MGVAAGEFMDLEANDPGRGIGFGALAGLAVCTAMPVSRIVAERLFPD